MVLGIPTVREIFEECWYDDLGGGLLESCGRLFQNNLRLYAYPWRDPAKGIVTAETFRPEPHLAKLYEFLCHNGSIRPLQEEDETHLDILSRDVLSKIRAGDSIWETMVPKPVATLIRARGLLGYSTCQGN